MPLPVIVVGAAILDAAGGTPRVLAAQRPAPPELAGRWEFPGGKVEPGESELAALVRECREELGVDVAVGDRLGSDVGIADGRAVLRVWTATVRRGWPRAIEHTALRWLRAAELDDVAWLPQDLPLVALLPPLLEAMSQPAGRHASDGTAAGSSERHGAVQSEAIGAGQGAGWCRAAATGSSEWDRP